MRAFDGSPTFYQVFIIDTACNTEIKMTDKIDLPARESSLLIGGSFESRLVPYALCSQFIVLIVVSCKR